MGSIPVANPTPPRRLRLRRGLVLAAMAVTLGLAAIVIVLAFAWRDSAPPTIVRAGSVDEYSNGQPIHFAASHFWLIRVSESEFIALSDRDTNLRFATDLCPIEWRDDIEFQGRPGVFRGKCSGSTFDINGRLHFGPAPRYMDQLRVDLEDGAVLIDTSRTFCNGAVQSRVTCPVY